MAKQPEKPRWRIRKRGGRWVVRQPGGGHFGTYFTHAEALAQATTRPTVVRAASSGNFDRRGTWDYDDHRGLAFGFQAQPETA